MEILNKYNKYIKGELSEQEAASFTKEIIKESFEEEDRKKHWKEVLEKDHSFSIKKRMPNEGKLNSIGSKKSYLKIGAIISMAASVLLVVYFSFLTQKTKSTPLEQLLSHHIDKPVTRNFQKGLSDPSGLRDKANVLYSNKKYEASIPLFEEIIQSGKGIEDDYFFLGLSYLHQNNTAFAIEQFDWILNQANPQRKDYATWYLGLALVASGDYRRSEIYLNEVASWQNNPGRIKLANSAKEILKEIKTGELK